MRLCAYDEANLLASGAVVVCLDGPSVLFARSLPMLLQQPRQTIFHADERLVLQLTVSLVVFDYVQECKLKSGVRLAVFGKEAQRLVSFFFLNGETVKKCLFDLSYFVIPETHFY